MTNIQLIQSSPGFGFSSTFLSLSFSLSKCATKGKMFRILYSGTGIVFVLFLSSSAFYSTLVLHGESVENKI